MIEITYMLRCEGIARTITVPVDRKSEVLAEIRRKRFELVSVTEAV
jgi:hypothetical protein